MISGNVNSEAYEDTGFYAGPNLKGNAGIGIPAVPKSFWVVLADKKFSSYQGAYFIVKISVSEEDTCSEQLWLAFLSKDNPQVALSARIK